MSPAALFSWIMAHPLTLLTLALPPLACWMSIAAAQLVPLMLSAEVSSMMTSMLSRTTAAVVFVWFTVLQCVCVKEYAAQLTQGACTGQQVMRQVHVFGAARNAWITSTCCVRWCDGVLSYRCNTLLLSSSLLPHVTRTKPCLPVSCSRSSKAGPCCPWSCTWQELQAQGVIAAALHCEQQCENRESALLKCPKQ